MNTLSLTLLTVGVLVGAAPLKASGPTAIEQYLLEMINRARANGNAEAEAYGLSDVMEGSPSIFGEPWTIQPVVPPLVWNEQLATAAVGHAQALFDAGFTSGDAQNFGGLSPEQRIDATGFETCTSCPKTTTVSGFIPGVENFGLAGRSGSYSNAQLQAEVRVMHRLSFADATTPGRLSRITIMNGWFREIGMGLVSGTLDGQGRIYLVVDFNRASPDTQIFLTGVAYNDTVTVDHFYTPGEGLGGMKVQAWQNGTMTTETTTWASGGYRLPLGAGTWQIKLVNAAGNVSEMGTVSLTSENVKLDSRSPVFTVTSSATVNLRITRSNNSAVMTWDDSSYSLAASVSGLDGPWNVVATTSPATITIQPGQRFFRCQK